jgi:hypothetical protein
MTIQGKVQNGVVVLEGGCALPEGTPVTVLVGPSALAPSAAQNELMSDEERRRILEVCDRIAALPIEGSREPFSGADHDKVLYGKP